MDEVLSLWQHPRQLSQKRRLAAAAAVTLATLPFTPLATSLVAGTAIRAGAAKTLLPGVLGAGISTGFATGRPVGDEGWFEFTRDDLGRIPGAATEGFLFGTATGGVGNLAFRGIQASDRLSPLLKNWAGRQTVNVGSGVGTEGAIYLLPDEFGRVRLTGGELGELAVSAALDPAVDPVLSGLQTGWDLGASVVARRPYGPSVTVDRPIRFSSEMFASSKPEAQRVQEAQEYLADWLKDLQANQPAHYNAIMETTGGRPPTLADFRLDRAIARNVDVVAMLQAREALSRGESYTIPETGVELYVNPTPFMAQRPGRATHAAPDIRWALEGGELQPLAGKGPANLGMFAFPEGAISDVFTRAYDSRFSTTDPDAVAGLVEIDADAGIMVPKVSMQKSPGTVDIRTVEDLPPQGEFLEAESGPPRGKRHRSTILLKDDQGRILLVKGKGDPFWGLPGGGVDPGEVAGVAAAREVGEETGYQVGDTTPVFDYNTPTTYHTVFEASVLNPEIQAQLQAKEIEDLRWWRPGEDLLVLPSNRHIIEQHTGSRPNAPSGMLDQVVPWAATQDWRQRTNPTGEIEVVVPVGHDLPQVDQLLRIQGTDAYYAVPEGAPPITRAQVARGIVRHLGVRLGLAEASGLHARFGQDLPLVADGPVQVHMETAAGMKYTLRLQSGQPIPPNSKVVSGRVKADIESVTRLLDSSRPH